MSATDPRLLALLDEPLSRALRAAAGDTPCHLVGGVVRDRLLGVEGSDYDAVVGGDGLEIGRRLSRDLPARLVHLGGEAFAAFRLAGDGFTLDIWDRGEQGLEADLARRDLTINAIALDIASFRVVDPFGGRDDLARGLLRATTPGVFADDPLRVLRLPRFAVRLPSFAVDPETVALARRSSAALAGVAAERVRDELGKLLRAPGLLPGFELLVESRLYPGLLLGRCGETGDAGPARRLLKRLEPALAQLAAREPLPHGQLEPAGPRLAALFAALPAAAVAEATERCRRKGYLTPREVARCRRLLACRQWPESEADARWLLHLWGEDWPAAAAALAVLPDPAVAAPDWRRLLDRLVRLADRQAAAVFAPQPLLDGDEIRRLLGLEPGPLVGAAVARLRRAQVEGRVSDRAGAEALLRRPASGAG